jgi:hypothetical protein
MGWPLKKEDQMTKLKLIAYSVAAIFFLVSAFNITSACAFRIISAETLTLRLSPRHGVELKAEGSRPSQPQAKE